MAYRKIVHVYYGGTVDLCESGVEFKDMSVKVMIFG